MSRVKDVPRPCRSSLLGFLGVWRRARGHHRGSTHIALLPAALEASREVPITTNYPKFVVAWSIQFSTLARVGLNPLFRIRVVSYFSPSPLSDSYCLRLEALKSSTFTQRPARNPVESVSHTPEAC